MAGGSMSNYSERKLQQALHQAGYYTQKAPSSGHGILDEETEEYLDQADIVAITAHNFQIPQEYAGTVWVPKVLIIEEKHRKPPTCQIEDHEKQQIERIQEITGGTALFAVSWKNHQGGHHLFTPEELQDTGKHWKITMDQEGRGIEDV